MIAMLWAQQIYFGHKTLEEVPTKLKAQVEEILKEMYKINGENE